MPERFFFMTSVTPPRSARFAGLDGLRAIAVALVLAYHLFPQWLFAGGFVGVDVFFVLSGFLITSLLLAERARTGRIRLVGFWKRRARRLLPALALVVTVCASAAWLVGGDVLARMGTQILGAATFSYNWMALGTGSAYFSAASPELFRNLWSLAVEEQFYVLWPLVLPLFLLIPSRWVRAGVAAVAAGGSAWWMAHLVTADGAVTRAYFGTDAHAFGLLLGVALAFVLPAVRSDPPAWMRHRAWRLAGLPVGVAALTGIIAIAMRPAGTDAATFPGALVAASIATLVAIVAGVWPGSWFGRVLDIPPLRWIGDRSYGLYLWHWPILVLVTAETGGPQNGVPVSAGAAALVLTIVASEASYRVVEMPVRRYGFRGALARVRGALRAGPASRFAAVTAVAGALLVTGGTTAAIASAPRETAAESAVQAGIDALRERDATPSPTPTPPGATPTPTPAPEETAPAITGEHITAIGDSVMLASASALMERFPGIAVDASVSRSMYAGPGILEQLAASGQLRECVVVALGTNGPIERETLQRLHEIVGSERDLVLVNAHAPRDWIPGVNEQLAAFAGARTGVVVADWTGAITPHEDLLAGDRIHPGDAGGRVFAQAVADAIADARTERDELAQRLLLRERLADAGLLSEPR